MRKKWAIRLSGLAVVATTASVALSRGPQNREPVPSGTAPPAMLMPAGVATTFPSPSGSGLLLSPQSLKVTGHHPVPAFDRALQTETRFQYEELSRGLFSQLPQRAPTIELAIALPANATDAAFVEYLRIGLRLELFRAMLDDRAKDVSPWLSQGVSEFQFATSARLAELDAECRRLVGKGEALSIDRLLRPVDWEGGGGRASSGQSLKFVAFLAQRLVGPEMRKSAGSDRGQFLKQLMATEQQGRQGGTRTAAQGWGFQNENEMQAAWLHWLKQPESRADWEPPQPNLPFNIPTPPTYVPATDVSLPPTVKTGAPVKPDNTQLIGLGVGWGPGV